MPTGKVLVLGEYRQTVTVVRSLGRAGYNVVLGSNEWRSSTALSRYVRDLRVFDESSRERFLDQLEAYLRHEKPDFVFPVGETQARRIAAAASRFLPLATWVMPHPATVLRCFDKTAMYELTPKLGIPTVPWREFTSAQDWAASARAMGFPVVVKRKDSSAHVKHKKALIFHSAEQFDNFLAELPSQPDCASLVLQKFAPGMRHNCHVAADQGRLIALFQQVVLRTDEPDGTGIGVEGASVPISARLRHYCKRLLANLGYSGVCCIQFMIEETSGSVAFLEINPRMDSTAALPYRLGYDYPLLAVQIAAKNKPAPTSTPYRKGIRYHWLYGDLMSWHDCLRHGRSSAVDLIAWVLRMCWASVSSHHLTWDVRDPLPTLHVFWKKIFDAALKRLQPALRPLPR
jgi:predicted ATP-grasp superfamily ATP-dependent carboligase